jgi:hypothetical protein
LLSAVAGGSTVHRKAGDIDQPLVMVDQQGDQQSGAAVGHVDRPRDLVTECQHVGQQGQQLRFRIGSQTTSPARSYTAIYSCQRSRNSPAVAVFVRSHETVDGMVAGDR